MNKKLAVEMKCGSCGHIQIANGFETPDGSRYFGSSANWCNACETGKPEPVKPLEPPVLALDQLVDLMVRTADDYAEDCVVAGYVTTKSKNRKLLEERIRATLAVLRAGH